MADRPSRRAFLQAAVAGASFSVPALVRTSVEAATYSQQGREQFWRGEWGAAVISLSKAFEIDPTDDEALDLRSVVFAALGEHDRAIADRTAIIRLNPSSLNYRMRGVYALGHDPVLAVADFTEVLLREPQNGDAYELRGIAYEEMGRLDLALADYRASQALDPKNAEWMTENIARVERLHQKG